VGGSDHGLIQGTIPSIHLEELSEAQESLIRITGLRTEI
jgi:hypothetical protein